MSNNIPVTFAIGTEAKINEESISEGKILLARDSGKLFIDGKDNKRFEIASANLEKGEGANAVQQFPQNADGYENKSWPTITDNQSINENIIKNSSIEKNEDGSRIKIGAFGNYSVSLNSASQAKGKRAVATGSCTVAAGSYSHAEGNDTIAQGPASHSEGITTSALGDYSHAEGSGSTAKGNNSHAEGGATQAEGENSHAEGSHTTASNYAAHAEGHKSCAEGNSSHAEGGNTLASGDYSHAEGGDTIASGQRSHVEGYLTQARGAASHSEGFNTIAAGDYQHVQGKFNIIDANYAFIIGNGQDNANRSNAFTVDWDGNIQIACQNIVSLNSDIIKIKPKVEVDDPAFSGLEYNFSKSGFAYNVNSSILVDLGKQEKPWYNIYAYFIKIYNIDNPSDEPLILDYNTLKSLINN